MLELFNGQMFCQMWVAARSTYWKGWQYGRFWGLSAQHLSEGHAVPELAILPQTLFALVEGSHVMEF